MTNAEQGTGIAASPQGAAMVEAVACRTAAQNGFGRAMSGVAALAVLALLGACATPPADPAARAEFEQLNDPLEPANRYIFEVNRFLDIMLIRPWADTYRRVVPEYGQHRVSSVLNNMGEPINFANEVLQGRFEDSFTTVGRFLLNSTVGLGGLFDVATEVGLEEKNGDFGQTLYTWGFPEGPYLVLPLFGPSNPRDGIGMGVDTVADPVSYSFRMGGFSEANWGRTGASAIDKRAEFIEPLDALERTSIDYYAQLRSMARQHRAKQLGGELSPMPSYDIYSDPSR
jgi:phospholipid-binding lipoprotein MlaA